MMQILRKLLCLLAFTSALNLAAASWAQQTSPPPGKSQVSLDEYELGINDEVMITIFGTPDQVVKTRVKEDGTITVPFIGVIKAKGETALLLSRSIVAALKSGGYLVNPIVNVDVTDFVSNVVTVSGSVGQPGVYPLNRSMTVSMLLAKAGGARTDGADYAVLKRGGNDEHRIDFNSLTGDWSGATLLQAGDSVLVPIRPVFFVYGQVNAPGKYPIDGAMSLRQALARAGGPTLAGTQKNVAIFRGDKKIKKAPLDMKIEPNDTVFVNERLF